MLNTNKRAKRNRKREFPSRVTIKDVAREAGVSIATVSRILNKTYPVKKEKVFKVQQAIQRLGYQPNILARRLAGGRLNAIGLIIPGYEGMFYSFYAQKIIKSVGLFLEAEKKDLLLHIFWGRDNFNSAIVEGVIFADIINNEKQLLRIYEEGKSLVVINRRIDGPPVDFVAIDNKEGARQLTSYLIELGHRKIAHITGDLNTQCAMDRLDGFKEALRENKINIPEHFIQIGNFSRLQARRAVDFLFQKEPHPTAIFCSSDDMAYESLIYLLEKGMDVPKKVSIAGFDNNPQYIYSPLSLTTVSQPLEEMVKCALELLEERISGKRKTPRRVILSPQLILGESTYQVPDS